MNLSIQIHFNSLKHLSNMCGICGYLLLIRPAIYTVFSRQRDVNAYASIDFSAVIFIIYSIVCFYYSFREINKRTSIFSHNLIVRSPLLWFVLYTIFGILSCFWSANPKLSGFRAFECLSMIMLIIVIVDNLFSNYDYDMIIKWSLLYVTTDILISIIKTACYSTDISLLLESSQMMSTVFFFMALYYSRKQWYHYLIMVMSLLSMSTVAYIGMAFGSISIFWCKPKFRTLVFLGSIAFVCVVAIIGPQKILKETLFFDKKEISIHETSGRDKLMEVSIKALINKPEGYGFFAGEPYLLRKVGHAAINAHNSLFSAAIGSGYVGIFLMIVFLIMIFKIVFSRFIPYEYRATLIGCFFVGFLHCMGNPGLGSRVYGSWLPVMYLFTLICGFYIREKYYEEIQDKHDEE